MAKSFFEKLTGASTGDDLEEKVNEEPQEEETTTIKQQPDITPKTTTRKPKSIKKIETIEEDKSWLQDADEGEEGQLTIDVYQTPTEIVIKSTVAGVKPEDIDISFTNDMITVRGRRKKEEEITTEDYYYQELYWGAFSRSVILPVEVDVDKAKAEIKNGILTVRLPKSEKIKTKKIKVNLG
ncbi:MAG: Hsp20/alpha crystallin family protein [Patescibacteria group bacterium]